jgi:endonuclease-3
VKKAPSAKKVAAAASSPFPKHARPTNKEVRVAYEGLLAIHGDPFYGRPAPTSVPVLDSLVRTMLSQNTTDLLSGQAFRTLKAAFPTWEQVRVAEETAVAAAINICGLSQIRAQRIQTILNKLAASPRGLSLEYLRQEDDATVKATLTAFNGVGPKTASCVLIFALGRADFPVDTHVWRICKKLGWVPAKATREQTYEHMNVHVPSELKHALHVLLVKHGKTCPKCASNGQNRFEPQGECPL